MRIEPRTLENSAWYLKPFFWNQRRRYGKALDAALLWARSPRLFLGVAALYGMIDRRASPIEPALRSLVTVRVSQLNACAFCVDLNSATLRKRGASLEKVAALGRWRDSSLFDKRERSVLDYAEAMTLSGAGVAGVISPASIRATSAPSSATRASTLRWHASSVANPLTCLAFAGTGDASFELTSNCTMGTPSLADPGILLRPPTPSLAIGQSAALWDTQDLGVVSAGSRYADHKAGGRYDAVVGAENGRAQSADAVGAMLFGVGGASHRLHALER